jgi:diguanylate cyclase (GGDEF)-like protein
MNVFIKQNLKLAGLSTVYIGSSILGIFISPLPPENIGVFWLAPGVAVLMFLFYGKKAGFFVLVSCALFNGYLFYSQNTGNSLFNLIVVSFIIALFSTLHAFIASVITIQLDIRSKIFNPNSSLTFYLYSCALPSVLTVWAIIMIPYITGFIPFDPKTPVMIFTKIIFFTAIFSLGTCLLLPFFFFKYASKYKRIIHSWKLSLLLIIPVIIILASFFCFDAFLFLLVPLMIITARSSGIFGVMVQSILIFFALVILIQSTESYSFLLASGFSYASIVFFIISISLTAYYIAITASISEYNAENLENKVKERTEALQKKNSDLLVLATTDSLTGISNRRHWEQIAELFFVKSKRYNSRLSLLMCDVDHFKKINDTYGHHIGDIVLIEISSLLTILLRSSDLIGRYGGEEFIILLPETDINHAIKAADKIRIIIEKFFQTNRDYPTCTISIGVSSIEPNDRSLEECILKADKALYYAKRNGRNRAIAYSPENCDIFAQT